MMPRDLPDDSVGARLFARMLKPTAVALLIAAVFVLLGALSSPTLRFLNDSYRYAEVALRLLGEEPSDAQAKALRAYCEANAGRAQQAAVRKPSPLRTEARSAAVTDCERKYETGLRPSNSRYKAIFSPRIGYPIIAVPFVAVLGVAEGMWLAAALCTALGGLLAFALLRALGASTAFAAAGQILFYVTPIGFWGNWPLAEAVTNTLTMAALLGAWWLVQHRTTAGSIVTAAALAAGAITKYSTFLLVAGALLAGAVACLLLVRATRHRGTYTLLGISAATAAGISLISRVRGWPGISETLQDTFTEHFTKPDVSDPWQRLIDLNLNYWGQWFEHQATHPILLLSLGLAAWGLWRWNREAALLVLAASATGIAMEIAHPLASQRDRLMAPVWLAVVIGVPLVLASLRDPRAASGNPDPLSSPRSMGAQRPADATRDRLLSAEVKHDLVSGSQTPQRHTSSR